MINDHSSKISSSRIFQIAKRFSSLSFAVSFENFDTFLNHI